MDKPSNIKFANFIVRPRMFSVLVKLLARACIYLLQMQSVFYEMATIVF